MFSNIRLRTQRSLIVIGFNAELILNKLPEKDKNKTAQAVFLLGGIMAWGLVSIVQLPSFEVQLKIAVASGGEKAFELSSALLTYGNVPSHDGAEFMAKFREFGGDGEVFVIGPDTEGLNKDFQVAGFNPLPNLVGRGFTHIVYLRLD